jgi:hypothetical protein
MTAIHSISQVSNSSILSITTGGQHGHLQHCSPSDPLTGNFTAIANKGGVSANYGQTGNTPLMVPISLSEFQVLQSNWSFTTFSF